MAITEAPSARRTRMTHRGARAVRHVVQDNESTDEAGHASSVSRWAPEREDPIPLRAPTVPLLIPRTRPDAAQSPANGFLRCPPLITLQERNLALRPRMSITAPEIEEMAGEGFEPSKAEPRGLQPRPFDRSGTPPRA